MRPNLFAGATVGPSLQGRSPAAAIKDIPFWFFCARDDEAGPVDIMRTQVRAVRLAGGEVRYTEYVTGKYADSTGRGNSGHIGGLFMGWATPAIIDWLLAQRRGVPSRAEPLLTITRPTAQAVWFTGAANLSLTASAAALDQEVTRLAWENTANQLTGVATGSNSNPGAVATVFPTIPRAAGKTNVIIVTGTTTSWVPACGGNTTFNDTLTVVSFPIQATLVLQGTTALLNWTGGGPPYRIQRATNLIADWTDVRSDATPPVVLPITGPSGFYRIMGQ